MNRTLPVNPSLVYLKHQAKDLLKAHSRGDSTVCDTLRGIHRFSDMPDDQILTADLSLNQAQFALALSYGFTSWNALKTYVESRRQQAAAVLEREELERLTRSDLAVLAQQWWKTQATNKGGGVFEWDEEITAVAALTPPADSLPDWALQVRNAMPRYGFELCSHRWLEGLDHVIQMLGDETYVQSKAGQCGDLPESIFDAALQRADAVESWLDGAVGPETLLTATIARWLGEPNAEKIEAARCFVDLVRSFPLEPGSNENRDAVAKRWRAKVKEAGILKELFDGAGLDGLLQNCCGFRFITQLDIYIQMIGGDMTRSAERHGVCNGQNKYIYPEDPARYETTRGYLWGLFAYLTGHDAEWLELNHPECAEAATHALNGVSRAGKPTPLRRWLVASLLKSTKLWIDHGVPKDRVPSEMRDLPNVLQGLTA